ncbi:MAG: preprotein translocase subunit SecY [Pseudomonadota bacterium]
MATAQEQLARNMNFGTFAKAKDLQNRLLFTLFILVLYRLGTFIPLPGVDPAQFAQFFQSQEGGMLGSMNMFAGGALERMSVFALNVMPYITASIIIQMMTASVPALEKLKKEGEAGRKQINQYTRYLTLGFAIVQSLFIGAGLAGVAYDDIPRWFFILTAVVTFTGGTMFLMWMGEQITARGVGNGISLIIFAGIIAEMPRAIFNLFTSGREGGAGNPVLIIGVAAMVIALTLFIVFIERSQRRVLIQYPKRQQAANAPAQGQSSFMPLKLNTSGVIPPIFAIAILMLPMTAVGFTSGSADAATAAGSGVMGWVATNFAPGQWTYIITYGVLVAFFTFFYTSIMFNPEETADNLRKYGGFVPGIRPGKNTAAYFDYVLTRLTTIGAIYLVFVCLMPEVLRRYVPTIPFYIGGTSLLIVVSVTMDTVTQIQSHLIAHQYEGLIKKSRLGGRRKR